MKKYYALYFFFGICVLLGLLLLFAWTHSKVITALWIAFGVVGVIYHGNTSTQFVSTVRTYCISLIWFLLGLVLPVVLYFIIGIWLVAGFCYVARCS